MPGDGRVPEIVALRRAAGRREVNKHVRPRDDEPRENANAKWHNPIWQAFQFSFLELTEDATRNGQTKWCVGSK